MKTILFNSKQLTGSEELYEEIEKKREIRIQSKEYEKVEKSERIL